MSRRQPFTGKRGTNEKSETSAKPEAFRASKNRDNQTRNNQPEHCAGPSAPTRSRRPLDPPKLWDKHTRRQQPSTRQAVIHQPAREARTFTLVHRNARDHLTQASSSPNSDFHIGPLARTGSFDTGLLHALSIHAESPSASTEQSNAQRPAHRDRLGQLPVRVRPLQKETMGNMILQSCVRLFR